ncbi:DUF1045 domain-containing protein [Roseobacter ponti]|uniref:DUF1045 domain-containing protein n=1 Tax=Roseobacter ponti TaxID=1891787 RepID=A0A858SV01_9RHOB|nr:DUF1045 domain-containing protein [Roseobacter ponti]QJF52515.1 DUF1045 domain-containing protein [Roseobacter ponti]
MNFERYGIYYTASDGAFARAGATWLGWDIATGESVGTPDEEIVGRPRRYGFHGTIKPPFRLAAQRDAQALKNALKDLCATLSPATTGALEISCLGRFLALTPGGDTQGLALLAGRVVRDLDPFRAPPTVQELEKRRRSRLSEQQEANLSRWGYPYVLEEFRFHMTLTGPLKEPLLAQTRAAAEVHFEGLCPDPFRVDSLTLTGEDASGMFHEVMRCPLGGAPAR